MKRVGAQCVDLRPGQAVELTVARIDASGDGVAERPGGCSVHVRGALPTERVRARIVEVSRQRPLAHAELDAVLAPAAGRRIPPCPHQSHCDGCPLMVADEPTQRAAKGAMLRDAHGLVVDRFEHDESAELGYRWSSKRVAGGRTGALVLGSYRRRSHQLTRMDECLVDHPAIAAAARELGRAASRLRVQPYRQTDGRGQLRYAWFKTDGRGRVLVCLVFAEPAERRAQELAAALRGAAGVAWCVQSAAGNALRGDEVATLRGSSSLTVDLGIPLRVGPLGFLQPNPRVAARAYRALIGMPDGASLGGARALDLYAGSGATTTLLRRSFREVAACEAYPESAHVLGVAPESAEALLARWLGRPRAERSADLVVANPPRAGLGETVCQRLAELRPERLHVMSCNPVTLRRDLDRLLEPAGPFRLETLRAFDTLPQTAHVELVAWLRAAGR